MVMPSPSGAGTNDGIDVFKGVSVQAALPLTSCITTSEDAAYVGLEIFDPEGEAVGDSVSTE